MTMQFHPLAECFPLMVGAEFEALCNSIKENGLREPITMYEDMILDGRNRWNACEKLDVAKSYTYLPNDTDPLKFVIDKNLHRRHLTESQRAMIAADLANIPHGGWGRGRLPQAGSVTAVEAGALLKVHPTSVRKAKQIMREGSAEQIAGIRSGEKRVSVVLDEIKKTRPLKPGGNKNKKGVLRNVGGNAARIESLRVNAQIWAKLRSGLEALSSLPLPSDVLSCIATRSNTAIINARLPSSLKWLKEFDHVWNSREAKG